MHPLDGVPGLGWQLSGGGYLMAGGTFLGVTPALRGGVQLPKSEAPWGAACLG